MTFNPFKPDEIEAAREQFAAALLAERKRNPFVEPDPFKAALAVWPEAEGGLPRALWVAHSSHWHEDKQILARVEELAEDAELMSEKEQLEIIRDKTKLKEALMLGLFRDFNVTIDPEMRVKLSDRISKFGGLDDKSNELPRNAVPFEEMTEEQINQELVNYGFNPSIFTE